MAGATGSEGGEAAAALGPTATVHGAGSTGRSHLQRRAGWRSLELCEADCGGDDREDAGAARRVGP